MDVGSVRVNLELRLLRHMVVARLLARGDDLADSEMLGLFVGFFGEAAGEHIAARMLFRCEVQRDHRELLAGAALAEEHFVVIAEPHELLDVLLCLLVDSGVLRCAVADLQDGHPAVVEVQELCLCFLEYLERQRCRTRIEIVDATCFHEKNLPKRIESWYSLISLAGDSLLSSF